MKNSSGSRGPHITSSPSFLSPGKNGTLTERIHESSFSGQALIRADKVYFTSAHLLITSGQVCATVTAVIYH